MLNLQTSGQKQRRTPEQEMIELVASEMLKGIDCATGRWLSEIESALQSSGSDDHKLAKIGQIISRFRSLVPGKSIPQAKPCRSV